ncbi:MAG: hypothetical protein QM820_06385 [Minicystis sp.]
MRLAFRSSLLALTLTACGAPAPPPPAEPAQVVAPAPTPAVEPAPAPTLTPAATAAPTAAPSAVVPPKAPAGPSYVACGCGCCGGTKPLDQCIYKSKGESLEKIEADDWRRHKDPHCATAGCSLGKRYHYCD